MRERLASAGARRPEVPRHSPQDPAAYAFWETVYWVVLARAPEGAGALPDRSTGRKSISTCGRNGGHCRNASPPKMRISIVIPCYNEARTIRTIVDRVRASQVPDKEIIIVDDGSRDGSRDFLRTQIAPLVDQVIYHEDNQGKGAALRTGFAAATGDDHHPARRRFRIRPGRVPQAAPTDFEGRPTWSSARDSSGAHRTASSISGTCRQQVRLTTLSNMLTNLNLTDMETCYKVFRREILKNITIEETASVRAGDHAKLSKLPVVDLRGRNQLLWPHLRRRKEDRMAGRLSRPLGHPQVQPVSLTLRLGRRGGLGFRPSTGRAPTWPGDIFRAGRAIASNRAMIKGG